MKLKFGCIKDKFDGRDFLMRAYLPAVKIPDRLDYTEKMSPVRDQGDEGTCVAFASVVGMKEYQEKLDYNRSVELSSRFLYQECKKIDGMPDTEGTSVRIAVKVLKKAGVCRENLCPYVPHQKPKITGRAVGDAKRFRVISYARILNLDDMRLSLAAKGPCVVGVVVFEGMMTAKTGLVPMPKKGERSLGGHAICPVGYDDRKKLIKFKNSWSEKWGLAGYGFLHYAYIEKYLMDAWSTVDVDDPNPLTINSVLKGVKRGKLAAGKTR